ncbi:MAG: CDP-diacylglycerol---serine O-phosphatidyltransferase [Blastocatellia bacterium]|jgi:CDP-diacylglycerol--serine O-phosphatidyltransferase|nr:CDP-diacylglycerol---serine O-phosphatidyltransferase [Blastocatellia bacterium]
MADTQATNPAQDSAAPVRRGIKKGLYLIPSLFTAANIGMGFYAVMSALKGFQYLGAGGEDFQSAAMHFDNAAKAIGWAFLFDALDGRIARITKTTTEIGVQFDSIADVVTFGLAPAILVYAWGYGSAFRDGSDLQNLGLFLSFMYLMCGAFRLARFNVQAARPRPLAEGTVKLDKKNFIGLPIPPAATLLASIIHFAPQPLIQYEPRLRTLYSGLLMALVGCLGALMVSTLRYTSFKAAGTHRRSARVMILLVASIGMLIWYFSRYVLLALAVLYVAHGLLFRLGAIFRRRPAKEALLSAAHEE